MCEYGASASQQVSNSWKPRPSPRRLPLALASGLFPCLAWRHPSGYQKAPMQLWWLSIHPAAGFRASQAPESEVGKVRGCVPHRGPAALVSPRRSYDSNVFHSGLQHVQAVVFPVRETITGASRGGLPVPVPRTCGEGVRWRRSRNAKQADLPWAGSESTGRLLAGAH